MHVIYRKLELITLDAEEHHAGTEAVRSLNKLEKIVLMIEHSLWRWLMLYVDHSLWSAH